MNNTCESLKSRSEDFAVDFGSTGLKVSRLALGTVKFGRNVQVKNACGDHFELPSDDVIRTLLDTCLEHEVNLIDTAPAYGSSEERLGTLLKGNRDRFVLTTKTGEDFDNNHSRYDFSAEHTRKSIERSLSRLKTDYLDSVLVHCHRDDVDIIKNTPVLETLANLKQAGHIRSFGVSTMSVEGGLLAVDLVDVVMVSFNHSYKKELPVIEKAAALNKAVIIKKGFCSGHLSAEVGATECLESIYAVKGAFTLSVGTINPEHLMSNIKVAKRVLG